MPFSGTVPALIRDLRPTQLLDHLAPNGTPHRCLITQTTKTTGGTRIALECGEAFELEGFYTETVALIGEADIYYP